jgi:hypothetical protein
VSSLDQRVDRQLDGITVLMSRKTRPVKIPTRVLYGTGSGPSTDEAQHGLQREARLVGR